VLAACATGPAAGRENAPAAITTAPTPVSSSVSATAGPLLAQLAQNLGAPGAVETYVWQLSDLRILFPATVVEQPAGTLADSYVLGGKATDPTSALVKEGDFQLILGAFWPNKDLPGQPTGKWYVSGSWMITDLTVPTPMIRLRQPPGVVTGKLVATFDNDPTKPGAALTLPITLPISRVNGVWCKGTGTLKLDPDRGGGTLTLVLDRRAR
jgi:hypothetical protein